MGLRLQSSHLALQCSSYRCHSCLAMQLGTALHLVHPSAFPCPPLPKEGRGGLFVKSLLKVRLE
jgi:hypothetical protein